MIGTEAPAKRGHGYAVYKRFAKGKTLGLGQFTCPKSNEIKGAPPEPSEAGPVGKEEYA